MNDSVRHILIVGGGSAGWLTAGMLAARFKLQIASGQMSVSLIESPNVPTVGVGEGTWPSMRTTLQSIGISENEFIQRCDVSFKQGSKFTGWCKGGDESYLHPFSMPEGFGKVNLANAWLAGDRSYSFSDSVSFQDALCEHSKAPKALSTPEYAHFANYGYHLNAGKFAAFLAEHCCQQLGVKHLLADVIGVEADEEGFLANIVTASQKVHADFFIDCTGFSSLLLGKHFGVKVKSQKHILFNDTAIVTQLPYAYDNQNIASYTLSTATESGWIWNIGTPSRRGIGYVYSSQHAKEETVRSQLHKYLDSVDASQVENAKAARKIQFDPGYREKFWVKNCVAIGISAGFIEPLEASALVMIEMAGKFLCEQFPKDRQIMEVLAKRFNQKFVYRWERIIDFLKLHYVLSERRDSDYWVDHKNVNSIPDSLQESLLIWRYHSPWVQDFESKDEMFPSASYQYVLYGMGFETETIEASPDERNLAMKLLKENAVRRDKLMSSLPTNRQLIDALSNV